ncbi:arginine--tRNA ligase [Patescibacteria group bacterium]|nr:arginine--tRNA ligase [Patescibacteria group bacterium]
MHLKIDPKIFADYPDFKAGAIIVKGLNNEKRSSALESLLRGVCAQRRTEFSKKIIDDESRIKVWNQAYGKFGINPKKKAPSVKALLQRLVAGGDISHINPLVDLYNYFSLKYLLPIGGEDLDWLCGDLELKYTKGGEAFRPMGSIDVKEAKEGEVAYMDSGGITCRYWNHRECERTKFTEKTVNALILVEDMGEMHMDEFGSVVNEVANAMMKYIGGRIEPYILNEENPELDLGVDGRTNVNDSKVTAQEKVHHLAELELKKKAREALKSPSKEKEEPKQKTLLQEEDKKLQLEAPTLLKSKLKLAVEKAVMLAYSNILNPEPKIEHPLIRDHGDYACNIAMQLAKDLKDTPLNIAEKIAKNLPTEDFEVEVAAPGFINFRLKKDLLKEELKQVLKEKDDFGKTNVGREKTIVLDYSSPNIAKPLGVHHLLSTIIGQSLNNIFEELSFNCVAINHIGDWGTQYGKLTYAFKKWGDKKKVQADPINELLKLYVRFHNEAEENPKLEDAGREEFRKFEQGDKENRKLWQWFVEESLKDLQKTYDKLGGIHFDKIQGESFYEDMLEGILKDGKERRIFEKGEQGAFVVHYDDENMAPLVVQKKDGATLYSTRDFATAKYRIEEFRPVRILYVVDLAQNLYFKQLFQGFERFPWYHGECVHVNFGRMHMKDGKMSTRKGTVVLLDEVLDEAKERSLKLLEEKSPNLADKQKIAEIIGVGAVKYSVLSQNRSTDIAFDWDKMLSLDGNSCPYLQYAYARCRSILRKSAEETKTRKDPADAEERLLRLLAFFPKFPEAVAQAAEQYKPNLIANYLYDLAQEFNSIYNSIPILSAENKKERERRLKIVEAVSQILKNGLKLLVIEVIEEM